MRVKLPLIGEIRTGKDADAPQVVTIVEPKSKVAEGAKEKFLNTLGGLMQFDNKRLSDEKTISSKILKANTEWVFRNNDVIAQEVSKIEFELFSVGLKGGEIVFNEVEEHPLLDLLDKFNSTTTKSDGIYITQSHKKLAGDAFWLLKKNGNTPVEVFTLQPDKIELKLGDPTKGDANLIEAYEYEDIIDGKRVRATYKREDIIHFKKPNPSNMFRGIGVVEALAQTIDTDNLTNETQKNFFLNGAITNLVLWTESNLNQEQIKRLRAEMRAAYTGAHNAYTAMIFGNGLKPEKLTLSNKELQFLELLEWLRDKIMIGFGNTKASLGIVDDVNRASYDGSYYGWLKSTVKPDMDAIVNTLNEFLVPMFGENLVLGYKNPIPEDNTVEVNQAVVLKKAGIIMINEAREVAGYDPVEGGDIFAPDGGVSTPGNEQGEDDPEKPVDDEKPEENIDEEESKAKQAKYIRRSTKPQGKLVNIPASLEHIDIKTLLRKRKMFTRLSANIQIKEAAKPIIRELLKNKKHKEAPKSRKHHQFTNDQIDGYYKKQIHVVDIIEQHFQGKVEKFIGKIEDAVLRNIDQEVSTRRSFSRLAKTKQLFIENDLLLEAQLDFYPLLVQIATLSGQQALELISQTTAPYIPLNMQNTIRESIRKFTESMLDTDREAIVKIISEGIKEGRSVPEIRDSITAKFVDIKRIQSERITRTEIIRVSNQAARDAYIQSGVVEAMQWLVAPNACPICIPYAGKIVGLRGRFYEPDNKFADGRPPKHPNCRCLLIPIVIGTRAVQPDTTKAIEDMTKTIKELEGQVDKRTKEYKSIKEQQLDDQAYIKALEKHLGVDDDE